MRRAALAIVCALFCLPGVAGAASDKVLRVLAWPGYADPEAVSSFEKKTGSRVEVTQIDSDDVLWQRVAANGGADFDVFAVNTAELARYIDASLVAVLDLSRIPNSKLQLPRFREVAKVPGIVRRNNLHAVPYTYADMGLIYDKKTFPVAPDSIAVMWDSRYRGKVLAYDGGTHNFSLAALKNGARNPFRIASADWRMLSAELIALRRNVLGFYSQPDESLKLYQQGKAVLLFANYGSQQVQAFRNAGLDVGYVIPREGALAWLDCWAIIAKTPQRALAEEWINHMLEPAVSALLVSRQGLSSTLAVTPGNEQALLHWLQPPEDVEKRSLLWKRIISGDRLEKVIAP
ncbi:MAG: extracellular solute-binding protein [Rhodocyclaceae bacterium]|nr:extracellular solute-binding protein [Rhodocyclaceae bacterium]